MYLNKKAILDSLTKEDIKKIVMSLGSGEPKTDREGNMIFQTICHNLPDENNSYKLYYYHEPNELKGYKGRTFHCYSGCSESFGIIELYIRAKRVQGKVMTWYKALYQIAQMTGHLIEGNKTIIDETEESDVTWIKNISKYLNKKEYPIPVLSEINPNVLEIFDYRPHEIWLNDNISREALGRFGIGYWGEHDAITIPHYDINDRLIGLRLRYLDKKDIETIGKYVPAVIQGKTLSHALGNNLYGLNVVQENVRKMRKVMLVEGEKSCLQAYSYFGEDSFVVACCGSNITKTQIKILQKLEVGEIIIAFDKEYHDPHSFEAEAYYQKLLKKIEPYVLQFKISLVLDTENKLEYKDSPTDKGKEVLLELLENKITITMDDIIEKFYREDETS